MVAVRLHRIDCLADVLLCIQTFYLTGELNALKMVFCRTMLWLMWECSSVYFYAGLKPCLIFSGTLSNYLLHIYSEFSSYGIQEVWKLCQWYVNFIMLCIAVARWVTHAIEPRSNSCCHPYESGIQILPTLLLCFSGLTLHVGMSKPYDGRVPVKGIW